LLTPHERPLYTLCLGILRNRDDAEDAVQEAFLRALRAMPTFRGDSSVRTWLQRIAVNVCLDWKRARRDALPLEAAERVVAGRPIENQVVDLVVALNALGTLSPHQRAALILKDVEGWRTDEIGAAMGWNSKKVENELYRARQGLARFRAKDVDP
jgi:RNA polymerase sigma-70 factor (ECF subfamily)